jgi:GTP-binding protein
LLRKAVFCDIVADDDALLKILDIHTERAEDRNQKATVEELVSAILMAPSQKARKSLRTLLLASKSPWLTSIKTDKKKKYKDKKKAAERNEVKFVGGWTQVHEMPETEMPEVTFLGRSNAGKSSTINLLSGAKKLAVVAKKPGRTRMINIFQVGNTCNFADLPGYGYAEVNDAMSATWDKSIMRYLKHRKNLKLAIVLIDASVEAMPIDDRAMELLEGIGIPMLVLATKADRLTEKERDEKLKALRERLHLEEEQLIPFSSKTGLGKNLVWSYINDACNGLLEWAAGDDAEGIDSE